jgi:hypothetical protein
MQPTLPTKNLVEDKQKSGYKQKSRADFTLRKVGALKFNHWLSMQFK